MSQRPKREGDWETIRTTVERLEEFAETLDVEERAMVRDMIDRSFDPLERMKLREGEELFDEEELRVLSRLEQNRRKLRVLP